MVIREFTGVVNDGSPLFAGVPHDPRRTIRLHRGEPASIRVRLRSRSGARIHLTFPADLARLTVRPTVGGPVFASVDGILAQEPGLVEFNFSVEDINDIPYRLNLYDVMIRFAGATMPVIQTSPLIVER